MRRPSAIRRLQELTSFILCPTLSSRAFSGCQVILASDSIFRLIEQAIVCSFSPNSRIPCVFIRNVSEEQGNFDLVVENDDLDAAVRTLADHLSGWFPKIKTAG